MGRDILWNWLMADIITIDRSHPLSQLNIAFIFHLLLHAILSVGLQVQSKQQCHSPFGVSTSAMQRSAFARLVTLSGC